MFGDDEEPAWSSVVHKEEDTGTSSQVQNVLARIPGTVVTE
jgi:hypothetical protein